MTAILGCVNVFLLLHLNLLVSGAEDVSKKFNEFRVVPDVISVAPSKLAKVVYAGGVRVMLGNELQPTQTLTSPSVDWDADPNSFYTLAMVDPDVPSRTLPLLREFLHWLVTNIPGSDVDNGETVAPYVSPAPPPTTGLHRYVFLIYKQPEYIEFDMSLLDFTTTQLRANFSISAFAAKYNLGNPLFGNFCQIQTLSIQIL